MCTSSVIRTVPLLHYDTVSYVQTWSFVCNRDDANNHFKLPVIQSCSSCSPFFFRWRPQIFQFNFRLRSKVTNLTYGPTNATSISAHHIHFSNISQARCHELVDVAHWTLRWGIIPAKYASGKMQYWYRVKRTLVIDSLHSGVRQVLRDTGWEKAAFMKNLNFIEIFVTESVAYVIMDIEKIHL